MEKKQSIPVKLASRPRFEPDAVEYNWHMLQWLLTEQVLIYEIIFLKYIQFIEEA